MIGTITRRSVLARKARFIIIGLAILLGVAFVSGSFILADSLRNTFDSLFSDLAQDIDLEVRSAQAFDGGRRRPGIRFRRASSTRWRRSRASRRSSPRCRASRS